MDNERDDWAQASETVLIFDQWMRAIVGTLRAERGATINQFWLLLLISERPQQSAATAAATLGLNYTTVAACAAPYPFRVLTMQSGVDNAVEWKDPRR